MIAADASALSAYFKGETGRTVELVATAMSGDLHLPPVVVTELLSDPLAAADMIATVSHFQLLPLLEGYWQRAGDTRRQLLAKGLRAKTADALIAQSCIDHGVALITRDQDFRHFAAHCGLQLA
ncbi:MAG TPA: PIN domain-containing protein [Rhizomicrobium sp.]